MKLDVVHKKGDAGSLEVLNQSSEGFVTRLVNEVQRSLALYRRQGQASNPERMLLSFGVHPSMAPLTPILDRALATVSPAQRAEIEARWLSHHAVRSGRDPCLRRKDPILRQ